MNTTSPQPELTALLQVLGCESSSWPAELELKDLLTQAEDLGGVWRLLRQLAVALGCSEKGEHFIFKLQQRLAAIASQSLAEEPVRVLCLASLEPLAVQGTWWPELLEMAGAHPLLSELGRPLRPLSLESVCQADPELLVLMLQGLDLSQMAAVWADCCAQPTWQALRAVQAQAVYLIDARAYLQPGPGLAEALEVLAEIVQPDLFDFGHQGRSWCRWLGRSD